MIQRASIITTPPAKKDEYHFMEEATMNSKPLLAPKENQIPTVGQLFESSAYRKVLFMSACFFMIFFGFMTVQNFQTTFTDPELLDIGTNSLTIVYITFTFTSLIAGKIVDRLGMRYSIMLAAPTYALFCAYNLKPSRGFAYTIAFFNGWGGSILWTVNGSWISIAMQEFSASGKFKAGSVTGIFNGTFFCLYQMSLVLGNLFVAIMFQTTNIDIIALVGVLTGICFLGSVLSIFLKEPKIQAEEKTENDTEINRSEESSIVTSMKMLLRKEFALLIPLIFATGVSTGFYYTALPAAVQNIVERFYILAVFGASDLAFSFLLGRLADKFGRKKILAAAFISHYVAFIFLSIVLASAEYEFKFFEFAICATLLGFGDATFNTQAYSFIGETFKSESTAAFGNFAFILNGGTAIASAYFLYVSISNQAVIYIVLMTASLCGLVGYNYLIKNLNSV
jgi:MFS family permease